MVTLVAFVQSAFAALVAFVAAGAGGGAVLAGAQAVKVNKVAAVAQSLRCMLRDTAGDGVTDQRGLFAGCW